MVGRAAGRAGVVLHNRFGLGRSTALWPDMQWVEMKNIERHRLVFGQLANGRCGRIARMNNNEPQPALNASTVKPER